MRHNTIGKLLVALCTTASLLGSCVKKELPVKAHEAGNATAASVDMGATYKYQIFYSLKDNKVIAQNEKTIWDLGFEASASGYHVTLNTSKSMFAMNTGKTTFTAVSFADTTGFSTHKKWDEASGNMDSTAFGDWRNKNEVYVVFLGYNDQGDEQGWAKVIVTSVTDSNYNIRFALLTAAWDTSMTVVKDSAYNLSFLSLRSKQQVSVEPAKNTWDLAFTQYTHIFYDEAPALPYLVTGCLLNRNNTTAVPDTVTRFDAISFGSVGNYTFSRSINTIGYDWKTYNGTGYIVNGKDAYVIKDAAGIYYKLHFTGFYNSAGIKGSPQWEYTRL